MCSESERLALSTSDWSATGVNRWASSCRTVDLVLLEQEEPGWEHWCVSTTGVGRLSLDAPSASASDDPRSKVVEIARTIGEAVRESRQGSHRRWKPSASVELAVRMFGDPSRPDASFQVVATHPSPLSRADLQIWPERTGSRSVSAGEDLTSIVPSRPCRAMMRRSGEGIRVLALDAPTTIIMLPALDAVQMLRLTAQAASGGGREG